MAFGRKPESFERANLASAYVILVGGKDQRAAYHAGHFDIAAQMFVKGPSAADALQHPAPVPPTFILHLILIRFPQCGQKDMIVLDFAIHHSEPINHI